MTIYGKHEGSGKTVREEKKTRDFIAVPFLR